MGIFQLSLEFGLLMVPRVILEIRLNFGRKFVCVYMYINVHYICELLMPCAPAGIMSTIFSQFSLSQVGVEAYGLKYGLVSRAYVRFVEVCK